MGHGKHVTGSSYPTPAPPPPIADYNVATNPELNPDCSCNYKIIDWYEGTPVCRRLDDTWFIWYYLEYNSWFISLIWGGLGSSFWVKEGTEIIGEYSPYGQATGTAIVSAGAH